MASRRENEPKPARSSRPPATTPDDRENQLISAAVNLAERQILNGTASAQVLTHYLKLGSSRERLEQQRLREENKLLEVKRETMEAAQRIESVYKEALDLMRAYSGNPVPPQEEDYED